MIHFQCPHCDHTIKVDDSAAGRSGKCSGCVERIQVPHSEPTLPTTIEPVEVIPQPVADYAPPVIVAPQTHVTVRQPKSTGSSFGIAALVLAALAFPVSWIPLINLLTIPLSLLSLLCGLIGFMAALFRGGRGLGYSIAGGGLALICLAFTWTSNEAVSNAIIASSKSYGRTSGRDDLPRAAVDSNVAAAPDTVTTPELKMPVELKAWDYSVEQDSLGDDSYRIRFSLLNTELKGIKLIDGSVRFYDLLDEYIYGIALDKDMTLPSGEIVTEDGLYGINRFISEQGRMKNIKREDIRAELVIRKVVFEDNEIRDFTKE